MEAERLAQWQAADALFGEWLDLPEDEHDAWLAAVQAPEAVRRRLLLLVAAHLAATRPPSPSRDALSGRRLGDWTLEEEIGRGGMAIVYRARRDQGMASQRAALKVLALATLGTAGRERFRREAGILARLNHPNITALVDSGIADDGTCWLAMPLVQGERIDRWCEAQALDARATVRLCLQVCAAVAYAHRNLVVHRDLKPSNVLVEPDGHVRLLDFGIGQFTDSTDERTQTMWRALTPGYAAPEQLRGDAPSTAVDVYGLGALLHRLLTGRTPAAAGGHETIRPSQLVRKADDACHRHYVSLRNDLDRVLLKALSEEPEQRYASAEALAADLQRWLEGRPVLAQKPKLGYRLRKFALRNKVGMAAAVLLAASLAGGIGATWWQASQARHAAGKALVQERRATAARDFMVQLFEANDPNAAMDRPLSARDLLDQGAHRVRDAFAEAPALRAEMLVLLGDLYRRIGELDAALPLLDEGVRLADAAGDTTLAMDARLAKGMLDADANRHADALAQFDATERLFEAAGRIPGELHGQLTMHHAQTLAALGKVPEAVALAEAALAHARAAATLPPESLFFYLRALSSAVRVDGQEQRAEALLHEAITLRSVDRLPPTARLPVHSSLAGFALDRGELEAALRESSVALELAEKVYLPNSVVRARLLNSHGVILTHMARFDEATAVIGQAIAALQAAGADRHRAALAAAYNNIALALDNAERDAEAEPYLIRAREIAGQAYGRDSRYYAIATANLGNLYRQSGRLAEADTLLGQALRMKRQLLGAAHPDVAHSLVQVARLRLRQDRAAEALRLVEQASRVYAEAGYKDARRLASTHSVRAIALAELGRVDDAVALLDQAIAEARSAGVDNGIEWPRVVAARAELLVRHRPRRASAAVGEAVQAHRQTYGENHPRTRKMLALAATLP